MGMGIHQRFAIVKEGEGTGERAGRARNGKGIGCPGASEMIVSVIKIVNQIVAHVPIRACTTPCRPIRASRRLNVFKCKR